MNNLKICKKCIYDETVPSISFDDEGICNYCHQMDELKNEFDTGTEKGEERIDNIIKKIKFDGRNKKYDCVVGVSGGTDS